MSSPVLADARVVGSLDQLVARLGHRFDDPALLDLALRHRSWCSENGNVESNERLEFLGDAVLGLVVTNELYRLAPEVSEGVLAKRRAELVNWRALAGVARTLDLGSHVLLGRGERATGGADKDSILADATEAVFGAVYLDAGHETATRIILELLADRIATVLSDDTVTDHKSHLQELTARRSPEELPVYSVVGEGPDHERWFSATVTVGGRVVGEGVGRTKKEAEQGAAAVALLAELDRSGSTAGRSQGGADHG